MLAAQAPDLHEALQEVAEQGWSHLVLDGKLIRTDRCAETTESVKGETINAWYSGKHRAPEHAPQDVTGHRIRARWYTTKTERSYDDMTVKLRRVIIAARFRGQCPEQATPRVTRAVLGAWAAAGT